MNTYVSTILLCLALSASVYAQKFKYAATCVAAQKKCTEMEAEKSVACRAGLYVAQQSIECRQNACSFCSWAEHWRTMPVCRKWAIQEWCFDGNDRPSNAKPSPAPEKVKLCLNENGPMSYWSKVEGGLIWREDADNKVDHEKGLGEICWKFKVPMVGSYYVTAITAAPRKTENNDLWIRMMSGLRLYDYRKNEFKEGGPGWFKGYQNRGGNTKSDKLFTVNFNPHPFVTRRLELDEEQTLCISGRSSKFTVYKIVLVPCSGELCNPYKQYLRDAMDGEKDLEC